MGSGLYRRFRGNSKFEIRNSKEIQSTKLSIILVILNRVVIASESVAGGERGNLARYALPSSEFAVSYVQCRDLTPEGCSKSLSNSLGQAYPSWNIFLVFTIGIAVFAYAITFLDKGFYVQTESHDHTQEYKQ